MILENLENYNFRFPNFFVQSEGVAEERVWGRNSVTPDLSAEILTQAERSAERLARRSSRLAEAIGEAQVGTGGSEAVMSGSASWICVSEVCEDFNSRTTNKNNPLKQGLFLLTRPA